MNRIGWVWFGLAGLAFAAGCADAVEVESMQERAVPSEDPDVVLTQAAVVLRREFDQVRVDRPARRITTAPVEYDTQSESGSARDLYGGRSTMRRVGTLSVGRRGDITVARLRIDIERQDTARATVLPAPAIPVGDSPGVDSPITRDAATTAEQNMVWTRVRRDFTLERRLLEELSDELARLAAEPAETAPSAQTQPGT
jgi:hypothetical protein